MDLFSTTFFYSDGKNLSATLTDSNLTPNGVTLLKWDEFDGWIQVSRAFSMQPRDRMTYHGSPGFYAWNTDAEATFEFYAS